MNHSIQQNLCSRRPKRRGSFVLSAILPCALTIVVALSTVGLHTWRVQQSENRLNSLNAQYKWQYETFDTSFGERPDRVRSQLAKWLGDATVSDIASVKITDRRVGDDQLSFLSQLKQLRSLDLGNDQLTDRTLGMIRHLPNLRYLTLAGERFSVFGLLQLRDLPNLKKLVFDQTHFTKIELAVLQMEMPDVLLADVATSPTEYPTSEFGKPAA